MLLLLLELCNTACPLCFKTGSAKPADQLSHLFMWCPIRACEDQRLFALAPLLACALLVTFCAHATSHHRQSVDGACVTSGTTIVSIT